MHGKLVCGIALLLGLTGAIAQGAINVTEPNGIGTELLAEGQAFSVYVMGNRWDMSGPEDIISWNSRELAEEEFVNGVYRSLTVESPQNPGSGLSDAKFFLTYQGLQDSMFSLASGQRYPIDTSVYDTLSMKIRHLSADGQPLDSDHPIFVYFFKDESPLISGLFGITDGKVVASDGDWHIVSWNLLTEISPGSAWNWTDFDSVKGLRIDPTNLADVRVEVDWVRLSASGSPQNQFNVAWTGGAPPYTISARQAGEPDAVLATEVDSSPFMVDLSLLPPGDYGIVVNDKSDSGESPQQLTINEAPLVVITQPDRKGDVDNSYAAVEAGNAWGPMDSGDVYLTAGMQSVSYANPIGSMIATTTSTDSRIVLNTPVPIDAFKYRMLSFTLSVSGINPEQRFAISRVFWGDRLDDTLKNSEDLVIIQGLNNYAIGDMRNVPLEGQLPGDWSGFPAWFRFDPHELSGNHQVRVDDITLAPLDTADPMFDITWEDRDADNNASIALYADVDQTPGNGNETLIASGLKEDSTTDLYRWNAPADVADGEYWLYAVADDGLNRVTHYADGPIAVGEGVPAQVAITQPDGVNDAVEVADEFSLNQLNNAWNMSDAYDVPFSRSSDIGSQQISGGIYSGTSTGNDSKFFLLYPGPTTGHVGSDGKATPIDTSRYRYLTLKIRYAGEGSSSLQVFFPKNEFFGPGTIGRTQFIGVPAGDWEIVTIDLEANSDPGSPFSWSEAGLVQGLRIDPTTQAGTQFEIDWVTLSAESKPANQYLVQWTSSDVGESTLELFVVDSGGTRVPVGEDINPADHSLLVDFSRWPVGDYSIEADLVPGPMFLSPGPISVTAGQIDVENELFSISTRADVGESESITIAGFIINGDTEKCIVIRGRGESVALPDGATNLQNPTLTLKQGSTTIDYNDDWLAHPSSSIIQGLGMAPEAASDAALYTCLAPGPYSALLRGRSGTALGTGIVEVVDADRGSPYLFSLSTRARVGPREKLVIAGFIIQGEQPREVLIRARGPSVNAASTLANPQLTLKQGAVTLVENDNWREAANWQDIQATGAAPAIDEESAILIVLEPGAYTALFRALDASYGTGIVEVIDLGGR